MHPVASRHVLMLASLGCAACSSLAPTLGDIRLVSVEVVHVRDRPDPHGPLLLPGELPSVFLLAVSFSTDDNLVELGRRAEYHTSAEGRLCASDNGPATRLGFGYVYWGDSIVDPYMKDDAYASVSSLRRPGAPFIYKTYSSVAAAETKYGAYPSPAYDLRRGPTDVCLRVGGGNILGMEYSSNEIVIPRVSIEEALNRAGMKVGGLAR